MSELYDLRNENSLYIPAADLHPASCILIEDARSAEALPKHLPWPLDTIADIDIDPIHVLYPAL